MLDERKKRVLQAIVESYIQTAEPVSSNAIMNFEGLECSSATIRNEMAELEKMGYLEKPHTSAGRVPTNGFCPLAMSEQAELNTIDNNILIFIMDYSQSLR